MKDNIKKFSDIRWYKGFRIIKNTDKSPGEVGYWYVPDLYYRKFGNRIEKGFESVSITQCKEAIDKWYDFNIKVRSFKNDDDDNEIIDLNIHEEYSKINKSDKIIVVDIQPSYVDYFNFDIRDFTQWLNKHKNSKILYLYNGPELGYEDEMEIRMWLKYNKLKQDNNILFYEKNYGYFREMIDSGIPDDIIIKIGKYMIKNDIIDSRDIEDEIPGVDPRIIKKYTMWIPDLQNILINFLNKNDKPIIVGGQEDECLKEVLLLLAMNDFKWVEEHEFIY